MSVDQPAVPSHAVVEAPPVPLGPLPVTFRGAPEIGRRHSFDLLLVGMALAFAFGIAVFPVRNSDVLMHLAAGRDLLQGKYLPFGSGEPYAHTTGGSGWVNHSWLLDVVAYLLNAAVGLSGLVVVKALLTVALGVVLIVLGRVGRGLWVPGLMAALAVLAVSPRLFLQPVVVSFLFLALTLLFLQRGGQWLFRTDTAVPEKIVWKDYWPILLLFVVWVNVDEWFFLGPITVGLYLAGQAIQRGGDAAPRPGEVRALGLIAVVGTLIPLLNPHHLFAFTLPPQLALTPVGAAIKDDPGLRSQFIPAFHQAFFQAPNTSVAQLSFFGLLFLTVASFGVNYRGIRWWRVTLAVFFAALCAYSARGVPFFAVVAGPIVALNFQEASRRASPARQGRGLMPALGRMLSFFTLLGLLVCIHPGWLHSRPSERHFSFADEIDPSLKETAESLGELHREGVVKVGYHFSPEMGSALAWYAPEVKGFFDQRYNAFDVETARDWMTVRKGLTANPFRLRFQEDDSDAVWADILESRGIDHVVLYAPDSDRLANPMFRLTMRPRTNDAKDWVLVRESGHAAVFARADGKNVKKLDYAERAYSTKTTDRAPADGIPRLPGERPIWAAFTSPPPGRTPESARAKLQLVLFDNESERTLHENRKLWERSLAGSLVGIGAAGPWAALPTATLDKAYHDKWDLVRVRSKESGTEIQQYAFAINFQQFVQRLDAGPTEHLVLAVRAARRAVHDHPDDARAYDALGTAYYQMIGKTRERVWMREIGWNDRAKFPMTVDPYPLKQLRHVQAAAALRSLLVLQKNNAFAHTMLADLYGEWRPRHLRGLSQFSDLELQHRSAALQLLKAAGPRVGQDRKDFENQIAELDEYVKNLEKAVDSNKTRFKIDRKAAKEEENRSAPEVRAVMAMRLALGGQALDELLASDRGGFGRNGSRLQLELALMIGRADLVKVIFDDLGEEALRKELTDPVYVWLGTLLAAATGDYTTAERLLAEMGQESERGYRWMQLAQQIGVPLDPAPDKIVKMSAEDVIMLAVGKLLADSAVPNTEPWSVPSSCLVLKNLQDRQYQLTDAMATMFSGHIEGANIHFLRGLLAVEEGDLVRARDAFKKADAMPTILRPVGQAPITFPIQRTVNEMMERIRD